MKWFILVLMMGTYSDGSNDTFIYYQPSFNSVKECSEYVYQMAPEIKQDMFIEFQGKPIDRVFCVREDRFKDILKVPGKET